jgi:glucose 1-dehydrogenase
MSMQSVMTSGGRFSGKRAIVTGGTSGIGAAIASRFIDEGASVVIVGTNRAKGESAAQTIGARFLPFDVGKATEAQRFLDNAVEILGGLDILVNNAGIVKSADFLSMAIEDFERVISVNLTGVFALSQAAARTMAMQIERGMRPGTIINVSSVNALLATPGLLAYCASKGGVAMLTRALAMELAPLGIRVNAVAPGTTLTDVASGMFEKHPALRDRLMSRTPLGRFASPQDIAGVAAFLASDDAAYLTGETINAEGGRLSLNVNIASDEK